jgi:bacillithiol synthase
MPFKKSKISLAETGRFSRLMIDYISGAEKLKKFYAEEPKIDSFEKVIQDRADKKINRELLRKVIEEQYHSKVKVPVSNFQNVNSNIELLSDKNTLTVCTGHQLCLFTGPLYFIYKIISTINLAEALKKNYPAYNFVPVYWMASEDHDFEEISSIHLFGKTLSWDSPEKGGPVGRLSTEGLDVMIEELAAILGDSENAKELISLFENGYLKHENLADATRYIVHELFSEYGLVIIDADDKRFKKEFEAIIKDDISNNTNYKIVNQTIAELELDGIKPQVNPREINIFRSGRERVRIEKANTETLNYPVEEYSPNVVLRPLYQQLILPNLAYVGGPGEIAYWMEYKKMFEHHEITFPVLIPRNFALLLDSKSVQQLNKLGFTFHDFFRGLDVLIKMFITKNSGEELSLLALEKKLNDVYSEISSKAASIDPTLKGSVESEKQKALNALKSIETKLLRAEKQKQESSINQIRKLYDKILPEDQLQERYENFAPYYLKYGKQFINDLKNSFDSFEFEMLILE